MIQLCKPKAVRLAIKISQSRENLFRDSMGYVVLYPDGSLGSTDGVCMVHSKDAHDADIDEPLFFRPLSSVPLSTSAVSYSIGDDLCSMTESRPRSEQTFDIETSRGVRMPSLHKALPGSMTPVAGETPLFDSVIGGRIASDYGLKRGVWLKGPWSDRVYLDMTDEGDTVVLAEIRRSHED